MSYSYLLDLYRALAERQTLIAREPSSASASGQSPYTKGRSDCLQHFERFLHDHYDHRLPRRLRDSLR